MERKNNRKGFTIVELVIVIAVIGVLTAILVPTFIGLTRKANEASDDSLVTNLNKALAIHEVQPGDTHNDTYQDAIDDLYAEGYRANVLVTKSDKTLLWCEKDNRFYLEQNGVIEKRPEGTADTDFWGIYTSVPQDQKYSIYAGLDWDSATSVVNGLSVGFDVGENDFESIAFVSSADQTVCIRTNSAATALTITAPEATVKHYGSVGSLKINAIDTASYHEFGKAAFAEIKTGRIVLEGQSEIKHIPVAANNGATGFEEVIIADNGAAALPATITRDEVTVSEQTLVVKVEAKGTSENVYVYANGAIGTTEKTATQNTDVESDLGKLVLDNGSTGDKALDNETKAETQAEVVDELAAEEVAEDPRADTFVARIGVNGYESFKAAVAAAQSGEKIHLLRDFSITETIGELTDDGFVNGLKNEVILDTNVTITFVGATQIQFNEGAAIRMNGHQLKLAASTENAGLFLVEIPSNVELQQALEENPVVLTLECDLERISSPSLANFVKFDGSEWQTSSQIVGSGESIVADFSEEDYEEISAGGKTILSGQTVTLSINDIEGLTNPQVYEWFVIEGDENNVAIISENLTANSVTVRGTNASNPNFSGLSCGRVGVKLVDGLDSYIYYWTITVNPSFPF